jgi:hypothetical protein
MVKALRNSTYRILFALVFVLALFISLTSGSLDAQSVTQGYSADEIMQRGMLVALKEDDTTKIEPADIGSAKRLHGAVVNPNDAPVTISDENQKVFVATIGRFDALVSTENGTIDQGDYITVSNVKGIGMKADGSATVVLGKALNGFDGNQNVISKTNITDSSGAAKGIAIGRILIDIGVGSNPLAKPEQLSLPGFLKRAAESIANGPVSAARVWIALVILIAVIAVVGAMLFAGIRSGIISIGRNPLSKKTIVRTIFQVILTSLIVLIIGVFGVYLVLVA